MKNKVIKKLNQVNDAITYYELKYDEVPEELYEYQKKLIKELKHED